MWITCPAPSGILPRVLESSFQCTRGLWMAPEIDIQCSIRDERLRRVLPTKQCQQNSATGMIQESWVPIHAFIRPSDAAPAHLSGESSERGDGSRGDAHLELGFSASLQCTLRTLCLVLENIYFNPHVQSFAIHLELLRECACAGTCKAISD